MEFLNDSKHIHLMAGSKMDRTSRTCRFFINLPSEIIINILARLPIRTILRCRCVCKEVLSLLSTPEFAAYHLPLSKPGLVIRHTSENINNYLYQVFDFEDEFELEHHNLHYNELMKFSPGVSIGLSEIILCGGGSVNGILCLRGSLSGQCDGLFLCNPITREYIALPRIEGVVKYPEVPDYGFGRSRISGQYKVIRNVYRYPPDHEAAPYSTILNSECLVYTVGTRSWRNIQPGEQFVHSYSVFSFFLNGNLHQLRDCGDLDDLLISCFDLETESYVPFPPLPQLGSHTFRALAILDDCLCFSANVSSQDSYCLVIWVMKEYAVKESWTKQFVIDGTPDFVGSRFDTVYPIKAFKDGDILLNYDGILLYFCNKTKTYRDFDLVIQGQDGFTEAIPHRSSFLSLKSFDGENVELFT